MIVTDYTRAQDIADGAEAVVTVRAAYDLSRLDLGSYDFNHATTCGCVCCGAQDAIKIQSASSPSGTTTTNSNHPDVPGDTSTTATISIGESVTDELEVVGDTDWFRITLQAGDKIDISLFGSGATPVSDTYLRLYDENGNLVAENDDGGNGLNSFLRFISENGGTYYIEADSYANNKVGEYTIEVTETQPIPVFTYDQIADQLTNGYWGGASRSFEVGADGQLTYDVSSLPADAQYLAEQALALWSDVTGIEFVSVTSGAEITFQDTDSGAYASSSRVGSTITSSRVNVSSDWLANYGTSLNSYSFQTYIHEIGHALGLGHAGNYNGGADYATDALYENDAWSTTVMSYFSQIENSYFSAQGFTYAFVTTPMNGDVVAITNLYGASTTTRLDDTTYGFNNTSGRDVYDASLNPGTAYAIYDSGGNDTLDYSGFGNNQLIDLRQEYFSNVGNEVGNVMVARGTVIENAIGGSGADAINGNSADNTLRGGTGNDTIQGFAGNDRLFGDAGDDILIGGASWDFLYGGSGADQLSGGAGQDYLQGDSDDDLLEGGSGNDRLIGGGGNDELRGDEGEDLLDGGASWDRLFGGQGSDTLLGGAGRDWLYGEDGTDTLEGGLHDDVLYGGNDVDTLRGDEGNDLLNGGAGDDQMFGGADDDTLLGGGGNDNLRGDAGNDVIDAGASWDRLNGGEGNDILTGGPGNDVFVFDQVGASNSDQITDFTSGADRIELVLSGGFGALGGPGGLAASAFHLGTTAQDADDRILYDQATGNLWYDADGSGAGAAVLFATLQPGTALSASDFLVSGSSQAPLPLTPDKDDLALVYNAIFA